MTGAGSGIGATAAYALSAQGCHVVLSDANLEKAKAVAQRCSSNVDNRIGAEGHNHKENISQEKRHAQTDIKPRVMPVRCNVTNVDDVKRLIQDADNMAKSIMTGQYGDCPTTLFPNKPLAGILVNCAGITRDALIQNMSQGASLAI